VQCKRPAVCGPEQFVRDRSNHSGNNDVTWPALIAVATGASGVAGGDITTDELCAASCAQLIELGLAGILKFLNTDSTETGLPCGVTTKADNVASHPFIASSVASTMISGTAAHYQQR